MRGAQYPFVLPIFLKNWVGEKRTSRVVLKNAVIKSSPLSQDGAGLSSVLDLPHLALIGFGHLLVSDKLGNDDAAFDTLVRFGLFKPALGTGHHLVRIRFSLKQRTRLGRRCGFGRRFPSGRRLWSLSRQVQAPGRFQERRVWPPLPP